MINIKDVFSSFDISLNELQIEQFNKYYNLLIEKNKVMNLTAITDYNEVIIKHFLDSAITYNEFKEGSRLIDVGTGAGFPSIPLKILRPDLSFVLVDSLNKRILFLNEVIKELNLKDVITIHSRSEDLANDIKFREKFDYCVSRAVAKLNTLTELCIPFIKENGVFIAYKGLNAQDEIDNATNCFKLLNCSLDKLVKYNLPDDYGERNIIYLKKNKKTAKIYPRKNNLPKNKPL